VLDGERLSYRTLAVEQIGSVYEAIMGFELHVAEGPSIALRPAKSNGAPTTVSLERLLKTPAGDRLKWLADNTDQKLTGKSVDELKAAKGLEELLAALDRKIDKEVTPNVVPKGAMIFQPSDERRRSGSHYTPSALTAPIVEAALAPVLRQLGENPTPEQILQLKVCDPAMGSGAFLVEACRQLGDVLVKAWHMHNSVPPIPPDEDEVLHARRRIAQRCLYGVDKNPLAADLAKLSLWLATLAKDHPFTFLDHAFRAGDSLVGLTRRQIAAFHWLPAQQQSFLEDQLRKRIDHVSEIRQRILAAADDTPYPVLRQKLDQAEEALFWMRLAGDATIAAFFSADKPKTREQARARLRDQLELALKNPGKFELTQPVEAAVASLRKGSKGVAPFHWELEFPEVFTTDDKGNVTAGFDVIVGNPPFMGGKRISTALGDCYRDWLPILHDESNSNSDLVAHFFRRAYNLLQMKGTFGLIATKTIGQGETRSTALRWIRKHDGTIYRVRRNLRWPGEAAVVVSVVHVAKNYRPLPFLLDNQEVPVITAYLFHTGPDDDPLPLKANSDKTFVGSFVLGMGFTFDDTEKDGSTNSLAEMQRAISANPRNADRIFPFISGEEINESPTQRPHRYIIDFFDRDLQECEEQWPQLVQIVREKVKPQRDTQKRDAIRERWWQYADKRPGLYAAIQNLDKVLVTPIVTKYLTFLFLPTRMVYSHKVQVFATDRNAFFCVLQSACHDLWARFLSSTLGETLNYSGSDCFETFPFPVAFETNDILERVGKECYEQRARVMVDLNTGPTMLYNRFHDPDETSEGILRVRELHDDVDRAVLDAYGWNDIHSKCEFLLDSEEEEDEEDNGSRRRRKLWRYRWPDQVRDEVLARLLELNRQRAIEEGQVPTVAPNSTESHASQNRKKPTAKGKVAVSKSTMFPEPKGV
jgi:hypothetical protein